MSIARQKGFKLEKVYLDSVDESGNCFIIYLARVDFYFLRFWYSGLLYSDHKGLTIERTAFRRIQIPTSAELIVLNQKTIQIEGTWKRTDDPILISLNKTDEKNKLIWDCHHPKALTEVRFNNDIYKGIGYAERIILKISPDKLPIDELRWGRFLSDTYTIIWINWKDRHPLNKIFLNGTEYNDSNIEEDRITFCNGIYCLSFSGITILRKRKFADIFSEMPVLRIFFSSRTLNMIEAKFKARTTFSKNTANISKGWSIFELVIWGKEKH